MGFPCFRPYLPPRQIFPLINKDLTFDKQVDIIKKTIKSKQEKYNLISDLKILHEIPLFQVIPTSKADIPPPSKKQRSHL